MISPRVPPWFVIAIALVAAAPAAAEFRQYSPPGGLNERSEKLELILSRAVENARWRFGRVYLDPWFSVSNLGYHDSADTRQGSRTVRDATVTAGVGLRGLVPLRDRLFLAAHALPEYVWWRDTAQRRHLNGRYGVGLIGQVRRFDLELTVQSSDTSEFFSREFEQRINTRNETAVGRLEFELGGGFALTGAVSRREVRFRRRDSSLPLDATNRDEQIDRFGLRYRSATDFYIGTGVEASAIDFQGGARLLDHSGSAPYVVVLYEAERLRLRGNVAQHKLDPDPPSEFIPFDRTTGSYFVAWKIIPPVALEVFGNRALIYSIRPEWPYYVDSGTGIGTTVSLGARASIRIFAEEGSNNYTAFDPPTDRRRDDFSTIGGEIQYNIGHVTIVLQGHETAYDSNLPIFDRTVRAISTSLVLGRRSSSPWG